MVMQFVLKFAVCVCLLGMLSAPSTAQEVPVPAKPPLAGASCPSDYPVVCQAGGSAVCCKSTDDCDNGYQQCVDSISNKAVEKLRAAKQTEKHLPTDSKVGNCMHFAPNRTNSYFLANTCTDPMQVTITWYPFGQPAQALTYRVGGKQSRIIAAHGTFNGWQEGAAQKGLGRDATDNTSITQENNAWFLQNRTQQFEYAVYVRKPNATSTAAPSETGIGLSFSKKIPIDSVDNIYHPVILWAEYEPN